MPKDTNEVMRKSNEELTADKEARSYQRKRRRCRRHRRRLLVPKVAKSYFNLSKISFSVIFFFGRLDRGELKLKLTCHH